MRPNCAAGSFYSSNPSELSQVVRSFLKPDLSSQEYLKVLIVPHAGYSYSGAVAGEGFSRLPEDTKTVILLGSSHNQYFQGAAVYDKGVWKTPLGSVMIDEEKARELLSDEEGIVSNLTLHEEEHSLEVEIPFLQEKLTNFKIIPILMGSSAEELEKSLSEKITSIFDDNTVLLISSDLSHYPTQSVAEKVDKETISAVLSGDPLILAKKIKETMQEGHEGLVTCACGESAIKVGLRVAKKIGADKGALFSYANSAHSTANISRVVGYASIGFYKDENVLSKEEKNALLRLARSSLKDFLTKGTRFWEGDLKADYLKDFSLVFKKAGVFVTLSKNGNLRGCIGVIETDEPLWKNISQMAVSAGVNDPRFPKVTIHELDDIKIEISVLTPKRKITSASEITLGKQGVWVQKGIRKGVFLPQVATETGWNKEEFLNQLCSQKAGLPEECWKDPDTEMFVFEAEVFKEA